MDLDSVAEELYSLPPDQFTATRNSREKAARSAGDRELAAGIHRLGKPNPAAWLANQLARQHPDEIRPLLELGAALRAATATLSGRQILELSRQQNQLVNALVRQARLLAGAAGRTVTEDAAHGLADTLHAALADEAAADQLRAGRLTESLQRSGFPPVVGTGAAGSPPAARPAVASVPAERTAAEPSRAERERAERAERIREAERAEKSARKAADDTAGARDRARTTAERSAKAAGDAAAVVDRLRGELDAATDQHVRLAQEAHDRQAELDEAEDAAQEAARRLAAATERREQLPA